MSSKYRFGAGHGKRWHKAVLFAGVLGGLLFLGGLFGIRTIYQQNLRAVNPAGSGNIVFVVASGDSVAVIADGLKEKKLIRSSQAFEQYVRIKQAAESFKAGTYSLKQSYDVPTIVEYLVEGKVDTNLFTILPGVRLELIRQAFIDKGGFTAAETDAALRPEQYADHPALVDKPAGASLEGYLYPDSYERISETRPETIIRQSLDEMAEALSPEVRAGLSAQGLSVFEGITLASIVEREVGSTEDRAKVAQVFLKRLRIGMMLESNATDDFPEEYNTYAIAGLPPGPISNVTKSSLGAVVNPAATDFTYFVSGRDCVTRFSQTISQHETLIGQHGLSTAPGAQCRN